MVSKATWQVTKKFPVVLFTQVIWKQGSFPNANAHSDSVSCSLLVLDRTWSMQCSTNPFPYQQAIISHFQLSCLDWCSLKTPVGSRKENPNVLKGKNIGKKSVLHSMPGHHLFLKASTAQPVQLHPAKDTELLQQDVPLTATSAKASWADQQTQTVCKTLDLRDCLRVNKSTAGRFQQKISKDSQAVLQFSQGVICHSSCPTITAHSHCSACAFPPLLGK